MKNLLKKTLAAALAAMIVLGAAPLAGLADISLSSFDIFASAAEEEPVWTVATDDMLEIEGNTITGYTDKLEGNIELPTKTANGTAITKIASGAFKNCSALTAVKIPESIVEIGSKSFVNCGLETVYFNAIACDTYDNALEGHSLFTGCDSLTKVVFGEKVTKIPECVCGSIPSLQKVEFKATVTEIENSAFYNCPSLEAIDISTVEIIGGNAFSYAGLKSVTIPGSIKLLGGYWSDEEQEIVDIAPFQYCDNLETVIIEEGVEELGYAALWDCRSIKKVVLPDTLKTVGMTAFGNCLELESLVIPASVEKFDTYAVYDCIKLKDIYYKGTQEQWNEIEFAEENEELKSIPVHFNYVTVDDILPEDGQIIRTPSTDTVKYGETLVLHSGIDALPDGMKIVWTAEGEGVTLAPSEDTLTCRVSCEESGSVTVTATLVDEEGNVATDMYGNEITTEQTITSKVNFIYKLISFFKNLFGFSRTILQAV